MKDNYLKFILISLDLKYQNKNRGKKKANRKPYILVRCLLLPSSILILVF